MENQNSISPAKTAPQNSLMWLKIRDYKQKNPEMKSILHQDLMWVKVNGYKQNSIHN